MIALTFKEFMGKCPAREDCVKECRIDIPMCQHLYREAIAPDLARQMAEENKKKKDD